MVAVISPETVSGPRVRPLMSCAMEPWARRRTAAAVRTSRATTVMIRGEEKTGRDPGPPVPSSQDWNFVAPEPVSTPEVLPMLEVRSLTKRYPNGHVALQDVSLTAGEGVLGLLGPNGA